MGNSLAVNSTQPDPEPRCSQSQVATFEESSVLKKVYEKLSCRVCQSKANPTETRWYRCAQLHQICNSCKEARIKSCSCGAKILGNSCGIIKEILSVKKRSRCANAHLGCQEFVEFEDTHSKQCDFRLVPCPYQHCGCHGSIKFKDVLAHHVHHSTFVAYAGMIGQMFPMQLIVMQNGQGTKHYQLSLQEGVNNLRIEYLPVKFEFNGRIFLSSGRTARNGHDTFYHWIHFLGSPEEAKEYTYTLEYKGKGVTSNFSGTPIPIDVPLAQILGHYGQYSCFTIGNCALLSQFVDERRNLEYTLTIKSTKDDERIELEDSGFEEQNNEQDTL